jgi:FtsX-like permease family
MLLVLAIVIALMGIANTLSLSIHERTRELGLLRAMGQTRTMVRGEALTVALFGTIGGLGLGLFLAWALVSALAGEGFGSFAVSKLSLAVVLALGALVGVLAAVRPARRPPAWTCCPPSPRSSRRAPRGSGRRGRPSGRRQAAGVEDRLQQRHREAFGVHRHHRHRAVRVAGGRLPEHLGQQAGVAAEQPPPRQAPAGRQDLRQQRAR